MYQNWKEYWDNQDEDIHRLYWIKLWGKWRRVPEFIYNWCNKDLARAKKWGIASIKINIPEADLYCDCGTWNDEHGEDCSLLQDQED